jgi:transcriptional regulator with XRE-family HTH domain
MSLGESFRRAREQQRLSQRQLADRAGVSSSYVTRLERGLANPTWRAIVKLATVLGTTPRLRLVPDRNAVATTAEFLSELKPVERLREQPVNLVGALSWLTQYGVPFVVIGAVGGLLQGFPTPATDLSILVEDTDEALLALQEVLLAQQLLFEELEPSELRPIVARSWPLNECEVHVRLVAQLPAAVTVELVSELAVRVLPPQALLEDEEVASMLGVVQMRSSEP